MAPSKVTVQRGPPSPQPRLFSDRCLPLLAARQAVIPAPNPTLPGPPFVFPYPATERTRKACPIRKVKCWAGSWTKSRIAAATKLRGRLSAAPAEYPSKRGRWCA